MIKPLTIALSLLGLSTAALAGAPGNNMVIPTGVNLIAPDSTGTWSFGLEALYMQSNQGFQYAELNNTTNPNVTTNNSQTVGNPWNWGVEADVSYLFPGSSRDVSLSYTHLEFDDKDSIASPGNVKIIISGFSGAPNGNSASADLNDDLNSANLTFGQLFHVGERVDLHPFAGVQFADIDSTHKLGYTLPISDTAVLGINAKINSDFVGAGPRAGIDGAVHLGAGFSVVGTMAGSLLVGDMSSSIKSVVNIGDQTAQNRANSDDNTAVVPELDAKLGLDYLYAFNPTVSMNAQLGYEVVNYFNAENNDILDMQSVNSVNQTSDFNYKGPYFRLQLNLA